MKKIFVFVLLVFSFIGFSQIDSGKKKVRISIDLPDQTITPTPQVAEPEIENKIQYKSVLNNENDYLKRYSINKNTAPSKSILDKSTDFKNPGDEIVSKMNKKLQDKPILDSYRSDQFLGQFSTKSKYVRIICYDHEYPDGDMVKILLNDATVITNIVLESTPREIYIDIFDGFNKLEFEALNQGTSGPNTAAFRVYDDKGNLITANEWNLTTGVKAKIVIVKEETK